MFKFRTHYDNLQVAESASSVVIRGAYKYLSQEWHPDKHPNDKEHADRIMKIINEAYAVLTDSERRRQHDEWIRAKRDQHREDPPNYGEEDNDYGFEEDEYENDAPIDQSNEFVSGECHPWRRYFARHVDYALSLIVYKLIVVSILPLVEISGFISPEVMGQWHWYSIEYPLINLIIFFVVIIVIEAFFISTFSTTPAKWAFGIRILKEDGSRLSFFEALLRSFLVLVLGVAFMMPLLSQILSFFSYLELNKTGDTHWDYSVNAIVEHKQWGLLRTVSAMAGYIIIIVIIAIMGTFVAVEVMDKPEQAQLNKIHSDIDTFGAALDFYKLQNYQYPTTEEGLAVLVPKHIKKMKPDPWKRDYLYVSPGRDGSDYEIYTLGRDGLEGGEGIDGDISSLTQE